MVQPVDQKEVKTAQRAWGWHLDEMREAAMMDDPVLDENSECPHPAPPVFGFTPINHLRESETAPFLPRLETINKPTASDIPRASKRRKTQPSTTTTASKPKKAAGSGKTTKTKTAAQLGCQDISQGLSRTKPTSSGNGGVRAKAALSFEDGSLEQTPKLQMIGDAPVESEMKSVFNVRKKQSEPSGLADKYQAAYSNGPDKVFTQATPPTPPKSDQVEAEIYPNDQAHDHDSATERQASPNVDFEPSIQNNPEFDGSILIRDYGAPPFTQTSPPSFAIADPRGDDMVDEFEPLESISNDIFEAGGIEYDDRGGEDEFPMDDECLEGMMQSMTVPAEEKLLSSDWRPQDFSDDTLCIDEQPENDQSHWSGAISDSEGVVIYDEDPTLVTSEDLNIPSSPPWSSQASCKLSHATGNTNPDRARLSGGSENCFDDNDLDDGLIGLLVDESKATFPVTPTKQPLSPKLQWLPPKTYTPKKSSQIPVSPAEDPHLVPMNFNSDALPFIRPPFPKAVRDRSPILGLNNRTVLRTCFRIGEALNAAAVASRTNIDAIIELYARVVTSSRESKGAHKQLFQFGDLFTDKPPYLVATYALWKGVELWDCDSKGLVGEQGREKMVRALGRIKRKEPVQGRRPEVEMVVLSIWEVDWEDVGMAKGVVVCHKES